MSSGFPRTCRRSGFAGGRAKSRGSRSFTCESLRLAVEPLEQRLLLTTINELAELHADDLAKGDRFGRSVDFAGDVAVVGAYKEDEKGRDSGAAYVFQRDDNDTLDPTDDDWIQVQKLVASDGARRDEFGTSVAITGNDIAGYTIAVVGGGDVYIYTGNGTDWAQRTKLPRPTGVSFGGYPERNALSMDGNTLVVAASGSDEAYVYTGSGEVWTEEDVLEGQNGEDFGTCVAVSGDTIAVGAYQSSAVYVFQKGGGGWSQAAILVRNDGGGFGWDAEISDDGTTIVASNIWSAYVFERSGTSWNGTITEDVSLWSLVDPEPVDNRFGFSVDIANDTIVVGAVSDPTYTAYLFVRSGSDWTWQASLTPGHSLGGSLGDAVATDGATILVGSSQDDVGGAGDAGSVFVFPNAGSTNQPPIAEGDSATTDEDTAVIIDVLANDSDGDGDALSITSIADPANGSAIDNGNGTVTYASDANFNGADSFTYTINDGRGGTDTANVSVTVTSVPDDPVAVNDTSTTDEDLAVDVQVLNNDSDGDNDTLAIIAVTQPTSGTVTNHGTYVTYTPDAGFTGPDTFTYTVDDGTGRTDTATVEMTVSLASSDTALYVYDIRFEEKRRGTWRAIFEIHGESSGDGVAGVAITVNFAGKTFSGTTDSNGIFVTSWVRKLKSGTDYYANALDLVMENHYWDPFALDLEDDSDGDGKPDDLLLF